MRMTEFNRQLDDLESMIQRLEPSVLRGAWLLFPVTHNPIPSDRILRAWLTDIGLPESVELHSRPARHDVKAPLLDVQDDISTIYSDWQLVKAPISKIADESGFRLVWVNSKLTEHYQRWLNTRDLPQNSGVSQCL